MRLFTCHSQLSDLTRALPTCLRVLQLSQKMHTASYSTALAFGTSATTTTSAGMQGKLAKGTARSKKALSAYNLFIQERARGRSSSGGMKQLAQEWKNLPAHSKTVYHNEAAELKRLALEARVQAPKGPTPAFAAFLKEKHAELTTGPNAVGTTAGQTDVMRKVAQLWKQLDPAEKQARLSAAAQARREWRQRVQAQAQMVPSAQ